MIRLKNVSKFYYSKGVIATGFTKVSLDFKIGEFVAITGESGSGKSTLLNVISGLDTYEEGEMYVDGKETSHYLEKEWEDYRRKYIGNIYQNFNLVNSYTVYQNIELVLLLNGVKKKEAKPKVLELIKKVDLMKFKNTKVSKLSGGQKQRVAIARALAKDVPVIIADEPTGSLDKRSAESIIRLLNELRKDKLVIIVTHNYEQVEDYVTRKITMHDGKVLEDKHLKDVTLNDEEPEKNNYKNITFFNKIALGLRNTFNVQVKFILLLLVYFFIVAALMTEYSSFKKSEYDNSNHGYNYVFDDISINRIVLRKKDRTPFSNEELEAIKKLDNIDNMMKNDAIVDTSFYLAATDNSYAIDGNPKMIGQLEGKVDYGRLPEAYNEVVVLGGKSDYYLSKKHDSLLEKVYKFSSTATTAMITDELKIVGIKLVDDSNYYQPYQLYFSDEMIDKLQYGVNEAYSTVSVTFLGKLHYNSSYNTSFKITPSDRVPRGQAFITEDLKYSCPKENCLWQGIHIAANNMYFTDSLDVSVSNYYNKKTLRNMVTINNWLDEDYNDLYNGRIYINVDDYNHLFNKGTYQISVYVKDPKLLDETLDKLDSLGYKTLAMKNALQRESGAAVIRIIKIIVTILLVVTLFFISYFIIKLILKSRNIYFTTIRMLGSPKKVARHLLIIELLTVTNIAYFGFILLVYLNKIQVLRWGPLAVIREFLTRSDYVIIYLITIVLSLLISEKYAAKIFKKSVMNSYREEV